MRTLLLLLMLGLMPAAAAADPPRILILGDSLSGAYGIATEDSWPTLLKGRLEAQGYPHTIINASVSGATTSNAKANLPAALERHSPAVVILQIGANDGLRGLSLSAMEQNLATMVEHAQAANAEVLLTGVRLPPNYGSAYLERFANVYRGVAEAHDIALLPRLLDGFEERRDLMLDDGIHPNEAGQEVILDNIWPHLEPLLAK